MKFPVLNEQLAEFIGVMLGDGTLTKNFIRIYGDSRYDLSYFKYLESLVKNLFDLKVKISARKDKNLLILTVCSTDLCRLLNGKYEFPYGNKLKKARIPNKVIEDKKLAISCLRGLIDTDGCVGKRGRWLRIVFFSRTPKLLEQVWEIGKHYNLFTYKYWEQVGTDSFDKIVKYFQIVGSSNLRHIVRFLEKYKNNKLLYVREVVDFYSNYKDISLPYKLGPVV